MTVRLPIDPELFDDEEFPRSRAPAAAPVSSNFENCPTCGIRKHLLMACSACGFSRSGNPERLANKPLHEAKPRYEARPQHYEAKPQQYEAKPQQYEANPRYVSNPNSRYDDHQRDYRVPNAIDQERPPPQHVPIVRWKRSKVPGAANGNQA